ncbi:uncharacterized protein LOC122369578 [Amphibalanus amphitrite]|uniref:uncharacterized protein LOC122369578 n=1 Tax=Amphibalanus amphitrite TaxID=1232801 RepID=UPI001C92810C|nr:uncharacterized protein LOC122369578 [Amphibalanus amphitrite]
MSDIEKLTQLLLQQAELSAQRERDSAQREERLTQMVERLVADRQPPATVAGDDASAATAARTSAAAPPVRLPAAATPAPQLSSSTSLRDFAVWREKLDGYMLLTGASALPVTAQRAALLSLLDEDWHRVLRYGLTIADDSPLSAVVDAMESHLRKQRSVLVDRRAFYARVQEQGENFEEFLCEVKELAAFCDFCTHCYDSRLRDKIVCGLRDEETVKRLLEDPGLDLKKTVDICRASENARATCSDLRSPTASRGHFAVVCAQVARESAAAPAERAAPERARPAVGQPSEPRICRVIRDVYVNGISTRPTPTVTVRLSTPAGVFTVPARADSGAEATVIGEDSLSSICVEPAQLEPCIGQPFSAVGKQPLTCVGSFRATLELGDQSTTAAVFVIRELTGLLLSWFDCVALGILPRDFPAQIRSAAALVECFPRVFGQDSTLRVMDGGPMTIEPRPDACPTSVTAARPIPFAWRAEVKAQLDDLLDRGVIVPVDYPTEWCHPISCVPKNPSGFRLCVDLTGLNRYVNRPTYPCRSPDDAVTSLPAGHRWMSTLDAKMGYFQVPLAESSQDLTCFITPWGRFKFVRCPMGCSASGDEYNRRGDAALGDIPNCVKIVDDILAVAQTYRQHLQQVIEILRRCDDRGITLNPLKFKFAQNEVKFCGYKITPAGYTTDNEKARAIADFPRPENVTDLRSFMGLVNQLSGLTPELAGSTQAFRDLLKSRRVWRWTEQHEAAFLHTKIVLSSPPVMAFFDPQLPTVLQTDAAKTRGLGFAVLQRHGEDWRVVQYGSRFLTDTESRYAVIELELAAVLWACKKCHVYLAGMPHFDLVVDHRPLVTILNYKQLNSIDNPRLQRMREKLLAFSFTTSWQKGSSHVIPDALSRAPTSDPAADDDGAVDTEDDPLHASVIAALQASARSEEGAQLAPLVDSTLERVRAAAERDTEYQTLSELILAGFPENRHETPPAVRAYWGVRHQLAIDDGLVVYGARLVIPSALRRGVLEKLHESHQGVDRTKRRARLSVYWPGIDKQIADTVAACAQCRQRLPSHAREPMWQEDGAPTRVFESVSADYFSAGGRTYLVYVDRLSGWPYVTVCPRTASADHLTRQLRLMFSQTGVPTVFRSDGGPQFASGTLRRFLQRWDVRHEMSSPHYPRANGHAEACVKTAKKLVLAASSSGRLDQDQLDRSLLELRNTPRADGRSPAQVLFGHPLRSGVPTHHRAFAPEWQRAAAVCEEKAAELQEQVVRRYDESTRRLSPLKIGSRVDLQDPATGRWNRIGVIVGVGQRRTYLVKTASGRVLWRNRRYLRPYRPLLTEPTPPVAPSAPRAPQRPPPPPPESTAVAAERAVRPAASAPVVCRSPPVRSPEVETAAAALPRRSRRQRRAPGRLRVQWGATSYEE